MNHSDECHKVDKAEEGGSEGWGGSYTGWMWKTSLIGWHLSQEPKHVQREHGGRRAFCTGGREAGSQDHWGGSMSDLKVMIVELQLTSLEVVGRGCFIPEYWWHFVGQLNMCSECKIEVRMTSDLRCKQQKVWICHLLRWRNHMKVVGLFVRFIIIKKQQQQKRIFKW